MSERMAELAARDSVIAKGKESEATSSKVVELDRNIGDVRNKRRPIMKRIPVTRTNLKRSKCRCLLEKILTHDYYVLKGTSKYINLSSLKKCLCQRLALTNQP